MHEKLLAFVSIGYTLVLSSVLYKVEDYVSPLGHTFAFLTSSGSS